MSVLTVMIMGISACSENEEDVSAPEITIRKPIENDTIYLSKSKIYIEVKAANNVDIDYMKMEVITQSGTLLYNYKESNIEKPTYICIEDFTYEDLYMLTKVKLIVTCENEYHAWRKKEVNFYIAP